MKVISEELFEALQKALNQIPNQRLELELFKDIYALASALEELERVSHAEHALDLIISDSLNSSSDRERVYAELADLIWTKIIILS